MWFSRVCVIHIGSLGPLGTAATNIPIVTAPEDYDDGEIGGMIGRGNRSTWSKPAPQCRFVHHRPHMLNGLETEPPRWEASDCCLNLINTKFSPEYEIFSPSRHGDKVIRLVARLLLYRL
jgi:hypothetical protein